jgi:hypothetical protein
MIGSNLSLASKDGSTVDLYSMLKYAAIKYGIVELKADVVEESNDKETFKMTSENNSASVKKENNTDIKKTIIPTGFQAIGKVRDNVSSNSTDSLLSYRNQWLADDGFVFYITSNRKNASDDKTRTWDNVEGVGHFIIDTDMSGRNATMFINPKGRPNEYFPIFIKDNANEFAYKMIYKKGKDVDLNKDKVVTPLVQFKLSNINWNDSRKIYKSSKEFYTFDGKPTGFLFKDEKAYGRFNGNSVVFIFEYQGKTVVRDFAGSIDQIKKEAEHIKSDYNLKADDIVIGRYDAGSFSAKPAAKNKKLDRNQWNSFNLRDGGSAMMIPSSNNTNYSKFDTEINPTQDFKDLIQSLSDKLGIPVRYDNNLPYAGAFIDGNVILNPSKMDETTVWHEFAHPFVQAIRKQNKPLYDNLVNEIYNTPHGKALLADVQKLYSDKSKKIQEEEVIVELIARYASGKVNEEYSGKEYESLWTKVANFIKEIGNTIVEFATDVAKAMNPLWFDGEVRFSVLDLNSNMNIKQMSEILKFGGIILLNNQDVIYEGKDFQIEENNKKIRTRKNQTRECERSIVNKEVLNQDLDLLERNILSKLRDLNVTSNNFLLEKIKNWSYIIDNIEKYLENLERAKRTREAFNWGNMIINDDTYNLFYEYINIHNAKVYLKVKEQNDKEISEFLKLNNDLLNETKRTIFFQNTYKVSDLKGVHHNIGAYMNNADIDKKDIKGAVENFINILSTSSMELAAWNGLGQKFDKGSIIISFKDESSVKQSYLHDVGTKLVDTFEDKERITNYRNVNENLEENSRTYTESIIVARKSNIKSISLIDKVDDDTFKSLKRLSELTGASIIIEATNETIYTPENKVEYQPEIYESRFTKTDVLKSILSDYGTSYDSFSPQLKSEIETKLTNNPELLNDSNFIKSLTC